MMLPPTEPTSILIVDDDEILGPRLQRAMADRGLEAWYARGQAEALALAEREAPDRVVLDLRMEDGDGLSTLQALRALDPTIAVVMLTGYGSIASAVEATRMGALNYVQKPAHADQILAAFEQVPGTVRTPSEDYTAPSLARAEWEHINRVLTDCGGNISLAARILGLHRRSLQRKLQKHPPRS
jgi:two-component system response regulator RegA